jgi:hypothetical protein
MSTRYKRVWTEEEVARLVTLYHEYKVIRGSGQRRRWPGSSLSTMSTRYKRVWTEEEVAWLVTLYHEYKV